MSNSNLLSERLEVVVHDDHASGFRVLELRGPLVIKTTAELESILRMENDLGLILDFTNVRYMDSSGLGAILAGYNLYQRRHSPFAIANINSRIQTTLEMTHTDALLNPQPSVDAAKALRTQTVRIAAG